MPAPTLKRRKFLGLGTAATAGMLGLHRDVAGQREGAETTQVRRYAKLARTGIEVSDISFGSSRLSDPDLVRYALERGVNFFDTAESYRSGKSEEAIGNALRCVPRQQVVLSSKTKAGVGDTHAELMLSLERSLRRLGTDYIDIYFNHAVNTVDRVQNPTWWEFIDRAKQQGKVRFSGVSGHGSRLAPVLEHVIDRDLVDVILVAYSFNEDPSFQDRMRHKLHYVALQTDLPGVLDKARAKNVGVLAMKTLMGARLNDMRPYERDGGTFAQAAFRWVLSSPRVDAVVISMASRERIDEYVGGSGETTRRSEDLQLLARYAYMQDAQYCRHGCAVCEGACPENVDIAEVLRTRMYDVDYGDRQLAKADYARLDGGAAACLTCAHQACRTACTYGIPIPTFTRDAASRLA